MSELEDLAREVVALRARLVAAEQVCVIFGWTASAGDSDRDKAVTQAWQDWSHAYGSVAPTPEWDARVWNLARRRDAIRERTLNQLRSERQSGADHG